MGENVTLAETIAVWLFRYRCERKEFIYQFCILRDMLLYLIRSGIAV